MVRGGDGMRFGAAHRKLWGSVSCLAVLLGLLVAGCGGGSSSPPGGVTVAINPSIVRVVVTGTQQFAANVTGRQVQPLLLLPTAPSARPTSSQLQPPRPTGSPRGRPS